MTFVQIQQLKNHYKMKENKNTIIEWAMKYRVFPLALAFIFGVIGIFGLFNMPRNEFPDFTIRQGLIVGVYPGASPEQATTEISTTAVASLLRLVSVV